MRGLWVRALLSAPYILPYGVIGSTADFDSASPGSSPGKVTISIMLRNTIHPKLLGQYINVIKKKEVGNHCALSLLMSLKDYQDGIYSLDSEFWEQDAQALIDSYEANKNWDDVFRFATQK